MPAEGIVTVPVPGLGAAVELVDFAVCMATGGDAFSCSPIGQLIDLFSGLFEGVPKLLKTQEAQARLAQSTLPQFKALAANLEIWVRNGVPLSTGDPTLRAQLEGWIHGTIYDSGLGLRVTPQGYDQFSAVDTTLWRVLASQYAYSGRALDTLVNNFRAVNRVLDQTGGGGSGGGGQGGKPPPPPAPPAWPFGTIPQPCAPVADPNADELGAGLTCIAENGAMVAYVLWQVYQAIKDGGSLGGKGGQSDSDCCAQVVAALTALGVRIDLSALATIASAVEAIAQAVANPATAPPVDLTPLVDGINSLTQAVQQFEKCVCEALKRTADANDAENERAKALVQHWASEIPGDGATNQLILQ